MIRSILMFMFVVFSSVNVLAATSYPVMAPLYVPRDTFSNFCTNMSLGVSKTCLLQGSANTNPPTTKIRSWNGAILYISYTDAGAGAGTGWQLTFESLDGATVYQIVQVSHAAGVATVTPYVYQRTVDASENVALPIPIAYLEGRVRVVGLGAPGAGDLLSLKVGLIMSDDI